MFKNIFSVDFLSVLFRASNHQDVDPQKKLKQIRILTYF